MWFWYENVTEIAIAITAVFQHDIKALANVKPWDHSSAFVALHASDHAVVEPHVNILCANLYHFFFLYLKSLLVA